MLQRLLQMTTGCAAALMLTTGVSNAELLTQVRVDFNADLNNPCIGEPASAVGILHVVIVDLPSGLLEIHRDSQGTLTGESGNEWIWTGNTTNIVPLVTESGFVGTFEQRFRLIGPGDLPSSFLKISAHLVIVDGEAIVDVSELSVTCHA
jgi:hypothetical protein